MEQNISVNIDQATYELIQSNGDSVSTLIQDMLEQYGIYNRKPFVSLDPSEIGLDDIIHAQSQALKKIHPYKRKAVDRLLIDVPECVDEIWIFGSSVTLHCGPDSDLDIAIVGAYNFKYEYQKREWLQSKNNFNLGDTDIKLFPTRVSADDHISIFFKHEIEEKGIKVFDRKEGGVI